MNGRPVTPFMAWALVALALLAAHFVIVTPLMAEYAAREARSEALAEVISQRRAMIEARAMLTARLEAAKSSTQSAGAVIAARDTSAVALLQEYLRRAAADRGLRVDTLRVLSDRAIDPLREVAVQASLRGTVARAQQLMHDLEAGTPSVRISGLGLLGRPGTPDLEIMLEIAAMAEGAGDAD